MQLHQHFKRSAHIKDDHLRNTAACRLPLKIHFAAHRTFEAPCFNFILFLRGKGTAVYSEALLLHHKRSNRAQCLQGRNSSVYLSQLTEVLTTIQNHLSLAHD